MVLKWRPALSLLLASRESFLGSIPRVHPTCQYNAPRSQMSEPLRRTRPCSPGVVLQTPAHAMRQPPTPVEADIHPRDPPDDISVRHKVRVSVRRSGDDGRRTSASASLITAAVRGNVRAAAVGQRLGSGPHARDRGDMEADRPVAQKMLLHCV